jgi:hypothetical protein
MRTDRRTDMTNLVRIVPLCKESNKKARYIDLIFEMTKLTVAFRNFVNAPKHEKKKTH